MPARSEDLSQIYYDRPHFCVDEQLYPESRGHIQHQFPTRNAAQAFISGVNASTQQQDLFSQQRKVTRNDFYEFCKTPNGQIAVVYDAENPKVYELFKGYAQEIKDVGREKYSAQAIIERIRWHMALQTTGDDFKINNNHSPYYARKLMNDDASFEGFFNLRSRQT